MKQLLTYETLLKRGADLCRLVRWMIGMRGWCFDAFPHADGLRVCAGAGMMAA